MSEPVYFIWFSVFEHLDMKPDFTYFARASSVYRAERHRWKIDHTLKCAAGVFHFHNKAGCHRPVFERACEHYIAGVMRDYKCELPDGTVKPAQ